MKTKIVTLLFVVLAIAMAVPSTRARMVEAMSPIMLSWDTSQAERQLGAMADQLQVRLGQGQQLPTNFDAWLRRDFSGSAEDPWGNLYYVDSRRRGFLTVGSMGPDGERNTDDDVTVQRELEGRRGR